MNTENLKIYPIKYTVEIGNFSVDLEKIDDIPDTTGFCDALILHSILLPDDGSRSELIYGYNGKDSQDISDSEKFKSLIGMAYNLKDSVELGEWQRNLCNRIFEHACKVVKAETQKRESHETI